MAYLGRLTPSKTEEQMKNDSPVVIGFRVMGIRVGSKRAQALSRLFHVEDAAEQFKKEAQKDPAYERIFVKKEVGIEGITRDGKTRRG